MLDPGLRKILVDTVVAFLMVAFAAWAISWLLDTVYERGRDRGYDEAIEITTRRYIGHCMQLWSDVPGANPRIICGQEFELDFGLPKGTVTE